MESSSLSCRPGRQIARAARPGANTVFQSVFMLTTVQPSSAALASAC
jgi:hypothetical protein